MKTLKTKNDTMKTALKTFSLLLLASVIGSEAQALDFGSIGRAGRVVNAARAACRERSVSSSNPVGGRQLAQLEGVEGLLHNVAIRGRPGPNGELVPRWCEAQRVGQYAPIAKINTSTNFESTAFFVSPCIVRATYHGIYGRVPRNQRVTPRIVLSVGHGSSRRNPFLHTNVEMEVIEVERNGPNRDEEDYVWLRVKGARGASCPGADPRIGWMRLAPNALRGVTEDLRTAGYPLVVNPLLADGSRTHRLMTETCNKGTREVDGFFVHYCSAMPGQSGAPMWVMRNGVPTVLATNLRALSHSNQVEREGDARHAAVSADVSASYSEQIPGLIQQDILEVGGAARNPQIQLNRPGQATADDQSSRCSSPSV